MASMPAENDAAVAPEPAAGRVEPGRAGTPADKAPEPAPEPAAAPRADGKREREAEAAGDDGSDRKRRKDSDAAEAPAPQPEPPREDAPGGLRTEPEPARTAPSRDASPARADAATAAAEPSTAPHEGTSDGRADGSASEGPAGPNGASAPAREPEVTRLEANEPVADEPAPNEPTPNGPATTEPANDGPESASVPGAAEAVADTKSEPATKEPTPRITTENTQHASQEPAPEAKETVPVAKEPTPQTDREPTPQTAKDPARDLTGTPPEPTTETTSEPREGIIATGNEPAVSSRGASKGASKEPEEATRNTKFPSKEPSVRPSARVSVEPSEAPESRSKSEPVAAAAGAGTVGAGQVEGPEHAEPESQPDVSVDSTAVVASVAVLERRSLGSVVYKPGELLVRGHELDLNCVLQVRVGAEYFGHETDALKRRKLWGTQVYTDDSDLVAVLAHEGLLPAAGSPPADLNVEILLLPVLERYAGSFRHGLNSREWRTRHDGISYMVLGKPRTMPAGWSHSGVGQQIERIQLLAEAREWQPVEIAYAD